MKKIFLSLVVFALLLCGVGSAFAESAFFTAPTVDTSVLGTMITGILASLALLWGARKAVKMINRS